ncbi:MAG: thioredoxin-like protein, partial [Linnemannia gamsii]
VVVDFFAEWCGPCKTLAPMLVNLEMKHKPTIFAKVDVDEAGDVAAKYEVKAMPTIVFFVEQKEVGRVVGADVAQIQSLIKKHE